ncbi:hypothetical protein NE237_006505 [Protea cynaroides]|uniref:Uncharacterized protein n=1 Tax=Protea cynaroides TaxID=273540 RepID=A0A9Q0KMM2_9MAGN|nr:hypothetical protein NE237_006505 [Protea cynaroides]
MEAHKLPYLNNILERESRVTLCDHLGNITYSEIIQLKYEEFVKMMLLDGCFILELILKYTVYGSKDSKDSKHPNDPIFNTTWMFPVIQLDLFLLENQLPFFVLERLFNLLTNYSIGVGSLDFVEDVNCSLEIIRHYPKLLSNRSNTRIFPGNCKPKHLLDFIPLLLLPSSSPPSSRMKPENNGEMMDIRSATEVHEAGVKFEKGPTTSLLDISFSNGVLKIPSIRIGTRQSLCFETSLIAYQQFTFIHSLVNSTKDVELLQRKGIIVNWLGGSEEVSALFNSLVKKVSITDSFYLSGVCSEVEKYYMIPWHKWKANLIHNYFNTPWAFISVCVALFLHILTGVQTIFSILPK